MYSPIFPVCAYGKAHHKPMQSKEENNKKKLITATAPVQSASVDKLVSPTPSFITTHRGRPTTQRYVGPTVFVDHFSNFSYIHLVEKLDGESTVEAKHNCEPVCKSHSVTIHNYHSDNGLFDSKYSRAQCLLMSKTYNFVESMPIAKMEK